VQHIGLSLHEKLICFFSFWFPVETNGQIFVIYVITSFPKHMFSKLWKLFPNTQEACRYE